MSVLKNIRMIEVGDFVQTLAKGKTVWTKVTKNTPIMGSVDFVRIDAVSNRNMRKATVVVTASHGIINAAPNGDLTIDSANNTIVGDRLIGSDGELLSVVNTTHFTMPSRYVFHTESTTVLTDGVLVSTICDETISNNGGEQLMKNGL